MQETAPSHDRESGDPEEPLPDGLAIARELDSPAAVGIGGEDVRDAYSDEDLDDETGASTVGAGLSILNGPDLTDVLGFSRIAQQIERSLAPDFSRFRANLFPVETAIGQSFLPAFSASEAFTSAVRRGGLASGFTVESTAVSRMLAGFQERQTSMVSGLLSNVDTATYFASAAKAVSGVADMHSASLAATYAQQFASRNVLGLTELADSLLSHRVFQNLTASLDFGANLAGSSVLSDQFGSTAVGEVASDAWSARQAAHAVGDKADTTRAGTIRSFNAKTLDLDAAPLSENEDLAPLQALGRLAVELRPHVRSDPMVGRWLIGLSTGGVGVGLMYLALHHPELTALLLTLLIGVGTSTKWTYDTSRRLFLPSQDETAPDGDD